MTRTLSIHRLKVLMVQDAEDDVTVVKDNNE